MIMTLGWMVSTQLLNTTYTHTVKTIWIQSKAAYEYIIQSTAVWIATTSIQVLKGLPQALGHKPSSVEWEGLVYKHSA